MIDPGTFAAICTAFVVAIIVAVVGVVLGQTSTPHREEGHPFWEGRDQ